MDYEEYNETRKEIIKKVMDKTYFTEEYFEKLKDNMEREKVWEEKINRLAQEYFTIIQDSIYTEIVSKEFNITQYGYYAILEYCLKQIKINDKNLRSGFATGLDKGEK